MPTTQVPPVLGNPYTQNGSNALDCAPFGGCAPQDATDQTGPWIPVLPGSTVQLQLNLTALTGTLAVWLETVNQSTAENPQFLASFQQSIVPGTFPISKPATCGAFIRWRSTPGSGGASSWTLTGRLIVPVPQV
jgi:hypothetical protein